MLQVPELGIVVEVRRDDDEVLEIVVSGRPRGFIAAEHVHVRQTERHRQLPTGEGDGRVLRPALRWNHDWAIARAREGLEPWARSRSAQG